MTTTTCASAPACPSRPACVTDRQTVYKPECPNCYWVQPNKNNLAYGIGNVLTFPFRAITGRELGQPDVVATHQVSEPMGQRVYTQKTRTSCHIDRCGQPYMKKTTMIRDAGLEPVGERLTTVKVIRLKPAPLCDMPACPPVGEQLCPAPVAERICPAPVPVAEICPAPVAERLCPARRVIIRRSCPAPVMERLNCPSYNCPSDSCNSCW